MSKEQPGIVLPPKDMYEVVAIVQDELIYGREDEILPKG